LLEPLAWLQHEQLQQLVVVQTSEPNVDRGQKQDIVDDTDQLLLKIVARLVKELQPSEQCQQEVSDVLTVMLRVVANTHNMECVMKKHTKCT